MWNFNCVHCNLQLTRPCLIVSHLVPILNVLGFADLGEGYGHWRHPCNITTQTWPPTLPKILLCLPLVLLFSVYWENVDVQIARQKFSQFSCSFLFFVCRLERATYVIRRYKILLAMLFICLFYQRALFNRRGREGKGKADPRILRFAMNYSSLAGCEWVYVCVRLAYFSVSCIIKHFCN